MRRVFREAKELVDAAREQALREGLTGDDYKEQIDTALDQWRELQRAHREREGGTLWHKNALSPRARATAVLQEIAPREQCKMAPSS